MDTQEYFMTIAHRTSEQFHKIPGSAIFVRYVKSSYQNDPIRSAVELFLVLFAIRYLLSPKYSTKPNHVTLSEEVRASCGTPQAASSGVRWLTSYDRRSMTWSRSGRRNRWWGRQQPSKKQSWRKEL